MTEGRTLRERVPRSAHARWEPAPGRDPIAILRAGDAHRLPELVPIRYGRMLASPFAFYRGGAAVMAADLATTPATGLRVQACGDCHLENFGGFATPERHVIFDVNDFDETLPAPWEWDVKRLAASFVLAARSNDLSESAARAAAVGCARAYRENIRAFSKMDVLDVWYARMDANELFSRLAGTNDRIRVERAFRKAAATGAAVEFSRLTDVVDGRIRIRDIPPLIYHASAERKAEFGPRATRALESYRDSLTPDRRILLDRYRYVDAAIKVVGVGSVGTRCWVVLLMCDDAEPLFLQFKEAGESALEPYAGKSDFGGGERVVVGQRLMQAASDLFLGWFDAPGESYYVRQLRDTKVSPPIAIFDARAMRAYAGACSWNLARAHAKTGDARAIGTYLGKNDEFDEAIGEFAVAYADQAATDYAALKAAVAAGEIQAQT